MLRRLLLVLVPVVALPMAARAAPFVFGYPVNVLWPGTSAVAVADFNGDGRDDLAAVRLHDYSENRLDFEVSLQRADGSMAPALKFVMASVFGTVHVADLGADGAREILVGHDKGLAVYRWDGTGGFRLEDHPGEYACRNIATADLDGDGAPDALCLGADADAMLYYSNPATVLAAPEYLQTPAMNAGLQGQAQLKDVTGDGKPDLVLASTGTNSFFVHPHDGDRAFLPAVVYTQVNTRASQSVEVFDLDHDGANEVVVTVPCNVPCASLHIYRQGAHGYLDRSQEFPTLDIPHALLASDVDADGHQDLLVGHWGWGTVGRYMGRESGLSMTELWSSIEVPHGSHTMAVGDLDHDGHADLAVANSLGVSVLYGGHAAVSDFNGDFVSDLVWLNGATGEAVRWHSADSTDAKPLSSREDLDWSVQAVADFEGDGLADLFWRNRTTGENWLSSQGHSQLEQPTLVASQDWQVVAAGDFDGDGHADLLWRNGRTGANAIWRSASATAPQAIASISDVRWKAAAVGDFDGDGQSDILWRHSTTGRNEIWRSGRHDMPLAVTDLSNLKWTVAGMGDFNGDGKDDLVWRNTGTGANSIWLSANSATPMAVTAVPSLAWNIGAVGDYNGDGRADLMWRNSNGTNVIWRSADSQQAQAVTSISGWSVVR